MTNHNAFLDELHARRQQIRHGGEACIEVQHARGKLTGRARERVQRLLDEGAFQAWHPLPCPFMPCLEQTNMSRLRHIYEPGMTYLITTITHRRERLFEDERLARATHEDIAFYARSWKTISGILRT